MNEDAFKMRTISQGISQSFQSRVRTVVGHIAKERTQLKIVRHIDHGEKNKHEIEEFREEYVDENRARLRSVVMRSSRRQAHDNQYWYCTHGGNDPQADGDGF